MSRTTLQIPLDSALRKDAEAAAVEQGFSSLQEVIRVFLRKFAQRTVNFRVDEEVILSPRAIKRYNKMTKEMEAGKNVYTANSIDELMRQLNESKI